MRLNQSSLSVLYQKQPLEFTRVKTFSSDQLPEDSSKNELLFSRHDRLWR